MRFHFFRIHMKTPKKIIIGYYGGMANNAYVAAKSAAFLRYNARYITDNSDQFPFSQPVWEDCEITLKHDEVYNGSWNSEKWRNIATCKKWNAPKFVAYPQAHTCSVPFLITSPLRWLLHRAYIQKHPNRAAVVGEFQKCDALFACGIEAVILAYYSRVPFVIWPHGGDIRAAAGLSKFSGGDLKARLCHHIQKYFLKKGFIHNLWIGTHDPKGIAGEMGGTQFPLKHFPLPLPARQRPSSKVDRHAALHGSLKKLGIQIPNAKYYCFVPSRISFAWKKTDLLLEAIKKLENTQDCHFIFTGWGEDYKTAAEIFTAGQVTFLPFALSKALLYKIFQGVDLVIDQFMLGTYGTSAIEAASCATPVMMHIDDNAFEKRKWVPPPVINCQTSQDILIALNNIINGDLDLDASGVHLHEWFLKTHHDRIVIPDFYNDIAHALQPKP